MADNDATILIILGVGLIFANSIMAEGILDWNKRFYHFTNEELTLKMIRLTGYLCAAFLILLGILSLMHIID